MIFVSQLTWEEANLKPVYPAGFEHGFEQGLNNVKMSHDLIWETRGNKEVFPGDAHRYIIYNCNFISLGSIQPSHLSKQGTTEGC